jgi:hypothetical protein
MLSQAKAWHPTFIISTVADYWCRSVPPAEFA